MQRRIQLNQDGSSRACDFVVVQHSAAGVSVVPQSALNTAVGNRLHYGRSQMPPLMNFSPPVLKPDGLWRTPLDSLGALTTQVGCRPLMNKPLRCVTTSRMHTGNQLLKRETQSPFEFCCWCVVCRGQCPNNRLFVNCV